MTVSAGDRPFLRVVVFALFLVFALGALIARLVQMQIVQGDAFAAKARANQVEVIPVAAPRGLIVDRTGRVLVRSRPSFVCALIPSEITNVDGTLRSLASILGIPAPTLRHRLFHHHDQNYATFDEIVVAEPNGPVILADDLTPAQTARLAEAQNDLPGVDMEEQPVRNYPYGKQGAHLFGYVGAIDPEEYAQRKRDGYSPNDVVGQDGLERAYDTWLHGRAGGGQIEVNASGALVRRLTPLDPIPGDTLVTTIDWRLQTLVEQNLRTMLAKWGGARHERLAGAVVVLDPYTGGVLALASMPEFDPNAFAMPIEPERYAALLRDKLNPLYDRAIGAASPTGSTFKMVTGTAAISSGVIKPHQILFDSGYWNCYGNLFRDIASRGLGNVGFEKALAASSDGYFYQLGYRQRTRHRHPRRISRQLADRSVDAGDVRQGLPSREERRVPARDRPRRDAGDALADRRRRRDRHQRRHALPPAYRRRDPLAARTRLAHLRARGHSPRPRHARIDTRSPGRDGGGDTTVGHGGRAGDPRSAVLRQNRDGRDRRRPP